MQAECLQNWGEINQYPQDFMTCDKLLLSDGVHLSRFGDEVMGKRLPSSFLHY